MTKKILTATLTVCSCVDGGPARAAAQMVPEKSAESLAAESRNLAPTARVFAASAGQQSCRPMEPGPDGSFTIAPADGSGAVVGLQWAEGIRLRRVGLTLAEGAAPETEAIKLHVQGEDWSWRELPDKPVAESGSYVWALPQGKDGRPLKAVKWVLSIGQPVIVRSFLAYAEPAVWLTAELRLESSAKNRPVVGIEAYNGLLLVGKGGESGRYTWDTGAPETLKVFYASPTSTKDSRTLLRFPHPAGGFSVAVEDVVTKGCVYVPHAGVFVTIAGKPVALKDHLAAMAARKTVLEQVRQMPDQTFEQAMGKTHKPCQDRGPTMLSLACDYRKFIVEASGEVAACCHENEFDRSLLKLLAPQFGAKPASRHLDGGWRPIPVSEFRLPNRVVWRQRTCVAPMEDEAPAEAASWARARAVCVVEWTVENTGSSEADVRLAVSFPVPKGARARNLEKVQEGLTVSDGGDLLVFIETAASDPLNVEVSGQNAVLSGKVPAGKTARCHAYLPGQKTSSANRASLAGGEDWFKRTAAYWDKVMAPAMQIDLPEPLLADIIRASQVHCMIAARSEDKGRRVSAWIASMSYGALDSESQAVIRGMDMIGQGEFSRRALDYWLCRYGQDGAMKKNYSIAGTGQNLWTLSEHYQRTADRAWIEQAAPKLTAACQWIVQQRRKSILTDNLGRPIPESGLTPPGTSADWKLAAYRFYNESLFYAGLSGAAEAMDDIGRPEAADLLKEARQYREDIARAYHWTQERSPVLELPGGASARGYPFMSGCFGLPEEFFARADGNRTWCYAVELGAHHLAVNGVLDPLSDEVAEMLDHMEDVQFLRSGWGDYPEAGNHKDPFNFGGFGKVQPYYARNAELCALRDDVKPFVRAYLNSLAAAISLENLSLWEHFNANLAWNKTHETGWFLCQSRIMLVQERADELWLAPFVTNNWLKDGMTVSVKNAPTRFGPVGYRIASSASKGFVEATIEPPARSAPKALVIRLRHPAGKPMRSVTVNGVPHTDFDPGREFVRLKPSMEKIAVRAEY